MSLLRSFLFFIGGIVLVLLIFALFLPGQYEVKRTIIIHAKPTEVFEQVVNLENWLAWNPWTEKDKNVSNVISEPAIGVGATWHWSGEIIGEGELEITTINEPNSIETQLTFIQPRSAKSTGKWEFKEIENEQTQITWSNNGNLSYPFERYLGLFVDGMIGPAFEKGLSNLKTICEQEETIDET